MTREELIQLAHDIMNAIGKTQEENDKLLLKFLDNVPDPNASDLFFLIENEDLTAQEIVDRALSYKPISL